LVLHSKTLKKKAKSRSVKMRIGARVGKFFKKRKTKKRHGVGRPRKGPEGKEMD